MRCQQGHFESKAALTYALGGHGLIAGSRGLEFALVGNAIGVDGRHDCKVSDRFGFGELVKSRKG